MGDQLFAFAAPGARVPNLRPQPGAIDPKRVYELLPDGVIGTQDDLEAVLKRIGRLEDGDGLGLSAWRAAVIDIYRLVVKDAQGRWVRVKETPHYPTHEEIVEAEQARVTTEFIKAEQFVPHWDGTRTIPVSDPMHPRFRERREQEAHTRKVFAPEFEALHAEIRELREIVAEFATQTTAA